MDLARELTLTQLMTPKGLMRTLSESALNAQTDFHFLRVE